MATNDNDPAMREATFPASEAYGRAALLLVESLIHGLCDDSTLSTGHAIEIANRAVSVEFDYAEAAASVGTPMWQSHALLSAIAASLKIDGEGEPAPTHLVS